MLNLLTKTKPWMVASLLVATSAFGQQSNNTNSCAPCQPKPQTQKCEPCCKPCKPCKELLPCPTIPAYNAPARIDTRCPWDVWVDASFIYWQGLQANMEPAFAVDNFSSAATALTSGSNTAPISGTIISFSPDYKPGFKVGAGMAFDHDNWDAGVEYTRWHTNNSRSGSGNTYVPLQIDTQMTTSFLTSLVSIGDVPNPALPRKFQEKWVLNMDWIDLTLGRSYYVGTQLTFRPSFGARGGWLKQQRNATYTAYLLNDTDLSTPLATLTNNVHTNSWAVGPRFALETNWMLGSCGCIDGIRLFGNGAVDIMFTRYKWSQVAASSVAATFSENMTQYKINTCRAHTDLQLGLGWGTYLDNNNWHIDLSASYGFQVFFDQNMLRPSPYGQTVVSNLYVHGLTATARLDF